MCPRRGSLSRHRRLWQVISNEIILEEDHRVLDFSPSRVMLKKFKKRCPGYISTDFSDNILVDKKYNITNLPEPDDSFQLIICYHILEHVEDDQKAMSELYRVLSNEGSVILQAPFKKGDIYENPAITSEKDRKIHFGQEDHVRIYSVEELKKRLESSGFHVNTRSFHEDEKNIHGFQKEEHVVFATKTGNK